jgi:adenylate cyclase
MVRGHLQTAYDLAEQRFRLAKDAQDPMVLPGSHQNIGAILFQFGEFARAHQHMTEGISLYDRLPEESLVIGSFDVRMGCLCYDAWALWFLGRPDEALKRADTMLALAERISDPVSLVFALIFVAGIHLFRGDPRTASEYTRQMLDLAKEHGFEYRIAQANILHGRALIELGRETDGIARLREGIEGWRQSGAEVMGPFYLCLLAEAYVLTERFEEAAPVIDEAIALAEKNADRCFEAELYRLRGEVFKRGAGGLGWEVGPVQLDLFEDVLAKRGADAGDARESYERALAIASDQQAQSFALRAATGYAALLHEAGDDDTANAILAPVFDWFTEGFGTRDLQRAKALLDTVQSAPVAA